MTCQRYLPGVNRNDDGSITRALFDCSAITGRPLRKKRTMYEIAFVCAGHVKTRAGTNGAEAAARILPALADLPRRVEVRRAACRAVTTRCDVVRGLRRVTPLEECVRARCRARDFRTDDFGRTTVRARLGAEEPARAGPALASSAVGGDARWLSCSRRTTAATAISATRAKSTNIVWAPIRRRGGSRSTDSRSIV
jgi:hypothetical protein